MVEAGMREKALELWGEEPDWVTWIPRRGSRLQACTATVLVLRA